MSRKNRTSLFRNRIWAYYNSISNGGNKTHFWRTLTKDEWEYLFYGRKEAADKCAPATVGGVHGLVLIPDVPTDTTSLPFVSGMSGGWNQNVYTKTQWLRMEKMGAVFLPAAGERYDGTKVRDCGATGNYWTVYTANRPKTAYYMHFSTQSPDITITAKFYGFSVRPVFP